MIPLCTKHGLPTAPITSRLANQRAAPPWITLPHRPSRVSVTTISPNRDRDFAQSVTV